MDNSRSAGRNPRMSSDARGGPPPLHTPGGAPTLRSPPSDLGRREISTQELASRFSAQKLGVNSPNKISRPSVGTYGSPVNLRANLFEIKFPKDIVMYDYVISINPPVSAEDVLRRQIVSQFVESKELSRYVRGIAHDGTQRLIAQGELNDISVTVRPEKGGEVYVVTLDGPAPKLPKGSKYANKPEGPFGPRILKSNDFASYLRGDNPAYNPLPILTAFHIIVTAHASREAVHRSGKNAYYFNPLQGEERPFPNKNYEVLHGFFAPLRLVSNRLMININACASTFFIPQARLSDVMLEYSRKSNEMGFFFELYGKIKVTTTYCGYSKQCKVKRFGPYSAAKTTFHAKDAKGPETVESYFRRKFGITLKHANDVPVVNIGTKDKDVFVPAELCRIDRGSPFTGPLSEKEAAMLGKEQSSSPQTRAKIISVKGLRLLGLDSNAPPMSSFKINISLDMASVPARVLPAPKIVYGQGQLLAPNDGTWSGRDIRYVKPAQVDPGKLVVLIVRDGGEDDFSGENDPAMREAVMGLLNKCRSRGMKFRDARPEVRTVNLPEESQDDPSRARAIVMIEKALGSFSSAPQLALVLLSEKDNNIYAGLKRIGDTKKGIQTMCALMSSIRAEGDQSGYISSLSLRMNAKLGGVNHNLEEEPLKWLKDTIVIGMHVSKPGAGSANGAPSVVAVVGSCDMNFVQYPASLGLQKPEKETIADVKKMVIQRMKEYKNNMKDYPQRVIVFRGATSEGATKRLMEEEVAVLQNALSELTIKPKLTYVTYAKGHQTRFYSANGNGCSAAGTVIDKQVISVSDFDFFLQSHGGDQGIPRATRYTVLVDESKFSADALQLGINSLCYLWAPATKSVSVVPAAYWADRACERARLYLHQVLNPIAGGVVSRMGEKDVYKKVQELWGNGVHPLLGNAMFYL